MAKKMLRVEIEVTAESPWGVGRACNIVMAEMEKGRPDGESALDKHGVYVKWRSFDLVAGTEQDIVNAKIFQSSLARKEAALSTPVPMVPITPDISKMDISDAKGIISTVNKVDDLDVFKMAEINSDRYPGGRKEVLKFIETQRKEMLAAAAARVAEAETAKAVADAAKAPEPVKEPEVPESVDLSDSGPADPEPAKPKAAKPTKPAKSKK